MVDEPENQADNYADDQAGAERKIKCAVFPAIADVAWQTADAEWKFWTEVEERTDEDEHHSNGEEQAAELSYRFHADSVALEGLWIQCARSLQLRFFAFRSESEHSG